MAEQELSQLLAGVTLDDISIDDEGRITLQNDELVERLKTELARRRPRPRPPTNKNCGGCNAVQGCGQFNVSCIIEPIP